MRIRDLVVVSIIIGLAACDDVSSPQATDDQPLREVLTPSIASSLAGDGSFADTFIAADGEITPAKATQLAQAYLRHVVPFHTPFLYLSRGSKFDLEELRPGKVIAPSSPYEPLGRDAPGHIARMHGRYYQVPFTDNSNETVIVIAVSAWNTDVDVSGQRLIMPTETGMNFFVSAIPRHIDAVITPEKAALTAHANTRARISAVPRPLHPGYPQAPTAVVWEVELETPVQVTSGGQEAVTSSVYISGTGRLLLPVPPGPAQESARNTDVRPGTVPLRPTMTDRYTEVTVRLGGAR